jgi:hypothetical protein
MDRNTDDQTETPTGQPASAANTALLPQSGNIDASYSADRIASGQPVRKPFRHDNAFWVCTGVTGSGLTGSGRTEHEAYRMMPESMFSGAPTTYGARIATGEMAEAARHDPNGFYHGVAVKHGHGTFVLCGPPVRFIAEEAAAQPAPRPKPLQLNLF